MRKIVSFVLLLLGSIVTIGAQPRTTVKFEHMSWNFGTINEVEGDVSHTFKFKNEGKIPFVINSVQVSCGCTTPRFSKEPIREGASGEIQVTFDPTNRPGRIDKSIYIVSNNSAPIVLTIDGFVVQRPRTIKDDYPFTVADGLRIALKSQVVGAVARGRTTTHTIGIANGGTKDVKVEVDNSKLPPYVRAVPKKATLAPDERSEIVISMTPPLSEQAWGKRRFSFPLMVNSVKQPEDIDIIATLVEDFSSLTPEKLRSAPIGDYSSYFYHFSDQEEGKSLSREFKITNSGTDPLIIRNLDPSSGRVQTKIDRTTIERGETATLTISVDTKGLKGRMSESVVVVTNDPVRPAREIRVLANMQP